jgi:hypothetical protein
MSDAMISREVIDRAIAAHARWKVRLRSAVSTGQIDGIALLEKTDNQCEFGQWLYGPELSDFEKRSEHYLKVEQLHTDFHREAAKVIDLIVSGERDTARRAIDGGGGYAKISTALTYAMVEWRNTLGP